MKPSTRAVRALVGIAGLLSIAGCADSPLLSPGEQPSASGSGEKDRDKAKLDISPGSLNFGGYGEQEKLEVTVRGSEGRKVEDPKVSFVSQDPAVAEVDEEGVVTALREGDTSIDGTFKGVKETVKVKVKRARNPEAKLLVTPRVLVFTEYGETRTLTVHAWDARGSYVGCEGVTYESLNPAVAAVSPTGVVTGRGRGVTAIRVTRGREETMVGVGVVGKDLQIGSVTISPSKVTLAPREQVQLTVVAKDVAGKVVERPITFASSDTTVAKVSGTGVVTAVATGTATITATVDGMSANVPVKVAPPLPWSTRADPEQLPPAVGQVWVPSGIGRPLRSGGSYIDPYSGVTVLKVTDQSTPVSNGGMDKGYSEGGPIISQPWVGSDGETYYTLKVASYLVDLRYGTLALSNWRPVPSQGEIGFAFSLDPATPRIAYTITRLSGSETRVNRYNTATNSMANSGNWPWVINTGDAFFLDWLQNNLNDRWFVAGVGAGGDVNRVVAFRPSDGMRREFNASSPGTPSIWPIDEPHIDRELPYVYLATGNDDAQNVVASLESGALRVPNRSADQSDDHAAPLRGMITGVSYFTRNQNYYYDVQYDRMVEFAPANLVRGTSGDWHTAGQWVFDNGSARAGSPDQWFVIDAWHNESELTAIRGGMIGIVRASPLSVRIVATHESRVTSYATQPQPTLSPDGKLVMWTSDMNGSDRYDTFLAKLPTRPK